MNINFLRLLDRVRSTLGMKRSQRRRARRFDRARPPLFRPQLELLEDRVTPSTSTPQALAVYHALSVAADHLAIELESVACAALARSQTIEQAIGPAFLHTAIRQIETDLTPLIKINFGGKPAGGLFGANTRAEFEQRASEFIRQRVTSEGFAHCATQVIGAGCGLTA